jgi:hypothetical protein
MRFAKAVIASVLCLSWLFPVSPSHAAEEYYLADGTRAMIIERQLILIRSDSRRSVARPGTYETRDGRTIIVKGNGIEIRPDTKGPR